jgi:membrane protease YdiL (CAAX protease family)
MLILIGISTLSNPPLAKKQNKVVIPGIVTGIATYLIFLLGNILLQWLFPSLHQQVLGVYRQLSPSKWWNYVVLFAVFVPGEEFFWRGVIQRLLMKIFNPYPAVVITAVLNGAALIYSGFLILPIAAFVSALIWGSLYINNNNIAGVLLAHLTFDLLLLVLIPLH